MFIQRVGSIALTYILTSFLLPSAYATSMEHLYERDWLTAGDGLITYDSSTGLEWLDLTVTMGNSILDTEADSSIFGPFSWASENQINTLMSHIAPLGSADSISGNDMELNQNTVEWINLIGATSHIIDKTDESIATHGISRESPSALVQDQFNLGMVGAILNSDGYGVFLPRSNCCLDEDDSLSYMGSWLVRVAVPEPDSATLFFIGIASFVFVARKRKKACWVSNLDDV